MRLTCLRDDIRIEEIPRHRNSKLNGPTRVSIALDREVTDLGTTQEVGLEIRAMRGKDPIVFNRQHDSTLLAVFRDHLRAFSAGALNHLAEPGFGVLHLPRRHGKTTFPSCL